MDEDEVVKQLMSMLGNKKQLKLKSADGKTLMLSIDNVFDMNDCISHNHLESELSTVNTEGNISIPHKEGEDEELKKFETVLELANQDESSMSAITPPFKSSQETPLHAEAKKISLSTKKKKVTVTNSAVLEFIEIKSEKSPNICITASNENIATKSMTKDASQSLQFLKESHPEEQEHLEIISQRIIELEKMEKDKLKLDEEISSILSASFSNNMSAVKLDSSLDASLMSISSLSITNINDPLCQIFNNYLRKNSTNKKSTSEKLPSFLFLYSQPMLDPKGKEINEQINYFEEESIIQKALKECKIDYIKEQGAIEKLNYWITQNVSIIHFCGHGVPDYLLFEGNAGQSVKLDADKLEKILKQLQNPLELVFVASCHSEATGKIFKDAGAVHVICIKENFQILDEACHEFTKIFYRSCIKDKMTICEAFNFAKNQIILSEKFTSHECSKFTILKSHCGTLCKSSLDIAKEGEFKDLTYKPFYNKILPSRVENFIARPKDLHEILKLIENKNRFISVIGGAGMGKSTLARELVRYIQFRNMFKDGVIYLDLRSCEKMLKIYELFVIELFDNVPGKLNKTPTENAQKIVKEIHQKEVLIMMDNCQSIMLSEDKNEFKKLIESILKNCDNVFFVFTNRYGIVRQIDYCSEKFYEIGKLTEIQTETLFFLRAPRKIEKEEFDKFLEVGGVKGFSEHPFFEFLHGHPEAICMTASLLSEKSLCELYELLMKPSFKNSLPQEKFLDADENMGINPLVEIAMKISLNVLKNKYKDSSEMIKTLSLLPGGCDSEMMSKLFLNWKETAKTLIDHSLVLCQEIGGFKYYSVHPYIIIFIESEIGQDEKMKLHEKIADEFLKRIEKFYRHIGTLSSSSNRAQEQFFIEQENYKAIILREFSFYGEKTKIKRLYLNLFQADYSDDEFMEKEEEYLTIKIKNLPVEPSHNQNKKRLPNEKVLQSTKKDSISLLLVLYATILFVTKSLACDYILEIGINLSRIKKKLISEANLLRIRGCQFLMKNRFEKAKENFINSCKIFAIEGCGLGAASCESAIGYLRLSEEEYAPAKKSMENALKYYDSIAHPFGKHYLNRWLCNLKTKMNRTERELFGHKEEAQKLLKETKMLLRANNLNNISSVKHKLGIFVFRYIFDNISLFLEASFEIDVKPRIINEVSLKNKNEGNSKFHEDLGNEEDDILVSFNKTEHMTKKNPHKKKIKSIQAHENNNL